MLMQEEDAMLPSTSTPMSAFSGFLENPTRQGHQHHHQTIGVVRPRSLFEAIEMPPHQQGFFGALPMSPAVTASPFALPTPSFSCMDSVSSSSSLSENGADLMQFCSPTKRCRPSPEASFPSMTADEVRATQGRGILHQKRKWDDVDEDEEEEARDANEEEELLDSSDEEEGDHHHARGKGARMLAKADQAAGAEQQPQQPQEVVLVSFPAETSGAMSLPKQQKVVQKKPDVRDIPRARHILLRFTDARETVAAKIVCKEPWGVRVEVLEDRLDMCVSAGTRYWARFTGDVSPITNIPVLEAMHPC